MKLKKCSKIDLCNYFFKILKLSTKLSQLLDEIQKIWNMFWKALDKYYNLSKRSNQKIHWNISKIVPKIKKNTIYKIFSIIAIL